MESFDVIVIGGGSGGCAFARRCASHGATVALIETSRLGGTCVNVGCVPKKIMWWASSVKEFVQESKQYGFDVEYKGLNWKYLKSRRDASVRRLNGVYEKNLKGAGVKIFSGVAYFDSDSAPTEEKSDWTVYVKLEDGKSTRLQGRHILIASGSRSTKLNLPGETELTTGSDGFFALDDLPKKIAILGAGYIAVEFSGMLAELGSEVHLFIRGDHVLRKFDTMVSEGVTKNLTKQGVHLHRQSKVASFRQEAGGKFVDLEDKSTHGPFDHIIVAIGREPNVEALQLDKLQPTLNLNDRYIAVDEYQATSLPRLYAIGDVIGKVELTPMAIAAGRRLADRLFLKGYSNVKVNYDNVPSVVFSHPPVGTAGLSEKEARERYNTVLTYTSTAVNLYYNVFDVEPSDKPKIHIKIVCALEPSGAETVVGIHLLGMGVDEVIQGFGGMIGRSKLELDSIVAVHPSASEEVVTCHPWGLPHPNNEIMRKHATITVDTDAGE